MRRTDIQGWSGLDYEDQSDPLLYSTVCYQWSSAALLGERYDRHSRARARLRIFDRCMGAFINMSITLFI
jgi:hypothetical protein